MFREELIIPLVANKRVLDCGGVDHSFTEKRQATGTWLHDTICQHAGTCLGVDILADRVEEINRTGRYKFTVANVEDLRFDEEFDVVVAGELIEHLYNPGRFLDSAWRALKSDGTLVITTPNCFSWSSHLYAVVTGKEVCHEEHTHWHSKHTLTYLVKTHGFDVQAFYFVDRESRYRILDYFRSLVTAIRPNLSLRLMLVARKLPKQNKYDDKW